MNIIYHQLFMKEFLKLSSKSQDKVEKTILLLSENPHDPLLKNHALHGKHKGKRSISAGGDLRLIF
jgi:mRNA-degrading endonuclease YafQ of YafQ-DinJ toxin-antitoxin module